MLEQATCLVSQVSRLRRIDFRRPCATYRILCLTLGIEPPLHPPHMISKLQTSVLKFGGPGGPPDMRVSKAATMRLTGLDQQFEA
jgi:hypothetical protein